MPMPRTFQNLELKASSFQLEQKRLAQPFAVKAISDTGSFEGHGAVFNTAHETSSWMLGPEWKDSIKPGAFTRTLAEHKVNGTTPLMLFMHERGNIPGAWQSVSEDKDGLALTGQVSKNAMTPSGVSVYELLKMGAINGLSIGFRVQKAALDEKKKVREILDVDLAEVSIVDIPGGPTARITDVKSKDIRSPQFLENVLRDAGLSRKEAKTLLVHGFTALRDVAAEDVEALRDAETFTDSKSESELLAKIKALTKAYRP